MVGIESWKEYFKWKDIPNLGYIHNLDPDEFKNLYCDSDYLKELINRLTEYHFASPGKDNIVFYGNEGCGKTSFCHFLRKVILSEKNLSDKYHIEILHMNSLMERDVVNVQTVYERLYHMIRSLLAPDTRRQKDENGKSIKLGIDNTILKEIEGNGDLSSKVNNLKDYIIRLVDKKCLKRLIVILDDTDPYGYNVLKQVSETFFQLLGPRFFFKCISFRPPVWKTINKEPNSFLHTWFYSSEEIIPPSLYEILERRFNAIGGYNFFDSYTCAVIQQFNLFDIKRSLECIEKILFYLKPNKDPILVLGKSGIIQYIKENFPLIVEILLRTDKIENLFLRENRFHKFLSVPKEILLFTRNCANNPTEKDMSSSFRLKFKEDYYIPDNSLQDALNHLIKENYMRKTEDNYFLSPKGTVYAELLKVPKIYKTMCINLINDTQDELHSGRKDNKKQREFAEENHFE